MTFKDVREIAATILCLAAAAAVLFVARAVNRIADTADMARVQAIAEIGAARADFTARIDSAAAAAVGEIQATRTEASRQITVTREAAVNELEAARGDLQTTVVASLTLANKHASKIEDQVDKATRIAAITLSPIKDTADAVAVAAPGLLKEYTATAHGVTEMAAAWGDAAPKIASQAEKLNGNVDKIAGHVDHITADVQRLVDNAVKPKTPKQILLQLLLPAALVGSKFL